jgi:hypothetical protein
MRRQKANCQYTFFTITPQKLNSPLNVTQKSISIERIVLYMRACVSAQQPNPPTNQSGNKRCAHYMMSPESANWLLWSQ